MAALLAAAAEPAPEISVRPLTSEGVTLIYGRDEQAIEAAKLLKDHLDVTVLISRPAHLAPPRVTDFPVVKGTIRSAKGHLGAFELTVDDYAAPAPSSRGALAFGPPRNGAVSRCDLMLDLSGGAPLFPAADLRDGYLRADPGDPAAVLRAVLKARDLVGTFDKPRYITFTDDLCAHSRSKIVGCHRCLDLCPTGAITPAGDHVAIDAQICAGCGQCAAVCPTGAAAYALPPADALMRKLRALLTTYREAGGKHPVVLLHDEDARRRTDRCAGAPRRRTAGQCAAARRQRGDAGRASKRSRRRSPMAPCAVRFLLRAKPRHDVAGLHKTIALAEPILAGLGFGGAPRRHDRDRRSRCARRKRCARSRPADGCADARRASCRSATSATCCGSRCANCTRRRRRRSMSSRCRRARRSARSRSMSRAARSASPACRPARPARCRTIPSGRCCASPRTPACSAGCARRPARRR